MKIHIKINFYLFKDVQGVLQIDGWKNNGIKLAHKMYNNFGRMKDMETDDSRNSFLRMCKFLVRVSGLSIGPKLT